MSSELAIQVTDEWTVSRNTVVSKLASVTAVETEAGYADATELLSRAKKLRKELETARKAVTSKLDAIKKSLMGDERKIADGLDAQIERVGAIVAAYATEQMRRREEEQRKAEEQARAAAEAAVASDDDDPFGIETAQGVEVLAPPVTERPRSSSSSVVMIPKVELLDEAKVPREFLTFDPQKVNAFLKYQKSLGVRISDIRIDGLRITEVASVRSR